LEEFKQVNIIIKSSEDKLVVLGNAILLDNMSFESKFKLLKHMAEQAIYEFLKEMEK